MAERRPLLLRSFTSQFLVGHAPVYDLRYYFREAVAVVHIFAIVESERLLIEVTEKMKRFDTNIGSAQASLEQAPEVLDSVCVNEPVNILHRVVNNLVRIVTLKTRVREKRISVKGRTGFDVVFDRRLQSCSPSICNDHCAYFTASLDDSHHCCFVFAAGASDSALALCDVHVSSLAADESLIGFNVATVAAHLLEERAGLHCKADTLKHEPSGFLSDADGSMNLIRANAVLARGNHPDRHQPLVQTERRVFKDRSDFRAELSLCVS